MKNKARKYRQYLDYTQLEMENLINMPLRTYQNKENGVSDFTNREMIVFKKVVQHEIEGITLDHIFSEI